MKGQIALIHCLYNVQTGSTTVEFERLVMLPDGYKSSFFLNPSGASIARLANSLSRCNQARIFTFKNGYSACISPPHEVRGV